MGLVRHLNNTLIYVQELLQDVRAENSDFVLEPAYLMLNRTLTDRSSLLVQLSSLPAPTSAEEREILRYASHKYKILIANAEEAVKALNAYVKGKN